MKSTLFSRNEQEMRVRIVSVALFFLCTFFVISTPVIAGQTPPNPTQIETSGMGDVTTFWALTKLGGGVSIAIFGVLALGLFLIVVQVYELIQDKVRGKMLLATNYRQLSVNEVNRLVMGEPSNLIARLYSVLLSIFHTTGNTRDFHDEIANYIKLQQDGFNTFKSRLAFLSDTAGALGLLGTVWGMFVTFFGGNLDSQRILNGMGLALVTTLIGLVVSIILNFCATEVFSVFNRRLELISSKADEFRLWLMAVVQKRQKKAAGEPSASGSNGPRQAMPQENNSRQKAPTLSLRGLSDAQQDGMIGQNLSKPIAVVVETEQGQRVAGVPVRFDVMDGGGSLDNLKSTAVSKTDNRGVAQLNWALGSMVGPQKLEVSMPNYAGRKIEFVAFARPFIPNLTSFDSTVSKPLGDGMLS